MTAASAAAGFSVATLFRMDPLGDDDALAAESGPVTDIAVRALGPRRDSVKAARDFAQDTLARWGAAQLSDDLALVVSELVTNALCHGVGASGEPGAATDTGGARDTAADPGTAGHPVQLAMLRKGRRVMCAVQDPGAGLPAPQDLGDGAETGRGLHIVECFSSSWGWFPLTGVAGRTGKVVWAMFQIPGQ
ncbi:ATP-binding protein [Yinghuangia seranimata]|uniref:ATP-binding protein n=1 Tax=Yinghuangia seranimata TaxID=408067 RepID=UPI00248B44EC|nr:ATP-binding protein [Yinghuangia seranimata]MDI2125919.1 ATP-binding protein [Yinghuangia seranimata]